MNRFAASLALVVVIALSGCTSTTQSPTPAPTPTQQAIDSTSTATPAAATGSPSDGGGRPGATGDAIAEQGEIQAYLVAAGDTLTDIATRFGVPADQLLKQNGASYLDSSKTIAPGDLVTFPATKRPYSPPIVLADAGPRDHARGEAVTDASGTIVGYIVAEGDRGDEIGLRFGTDATHIYHDDGEYVGKNIVVWLPELHPGDALRFTPQPA